MTSDTSSTSPSDFRPELATRQLTWRRKASVDQEPFVHRVRGQQHVRDLAFPVSSWQDNLWPGIQAEVTRRLLGGVQAHQWKNHLLSSWVVFEPVPAVRRHIEGRELLAGFFRAQVAPTLVRIIRVELEYAPEESDDLHPSELLGESGGKRGSGQTSPDLAFFGELESGAAAIFFVESKLTEHSFYACSHLKRTNPNLEPERCKHMGDVVHSPGTMCHQNQAAPQGMGRRYWTLLQETANVADLEGLPHCPALHAGYQLVRQQALAEGYASSGRFGLVVSAIAYDARNADLISSLAKSGVADFRTGWGGLFRGKSQFRTWTHQAWVNWVREHGQRERWGAWLTYVEERYGYGELLGLEHFAD